MEYTKILFYLGRLLFGGYFVMSGINHFRHAAMLAGYAQSKGVKSPKMAVGLTGVLLVLGGLGLVLGIYVQLSVLVLAVFLLAVSFMMHAYWKVSDPQAKMMDQVQFMKNMALLGAAFLMLSIPAPWN